MENSIQNNVKQMQNYILEIMDEVHRICKINDINYVMIGGTMLGTVRHKGFIPWDDDADVGVLRKDIDKFIQCCKTQLNEKYVIDVCYEDKKDFLPFIKIRMKDIFWTVPVKRRGLFLYHKFTLDIFPLDNFPDTKKEQKRQKFLLKYYGNLILGKKRLNADNKVKWIIRSTLSFLYPTSLAYLKRRYQNICQSYNNKQTTFVTVTGTSYPYGKEIIENKNIVNLSLYKFENSQFYTLTNPIGYLERVYGDYMSLPPVEERFGTKHDTNGFIFDFPKKNVISK